MLRWLLPWAQRDSDAGQRKRKGRARRNVAGGISPILGLASNNCTPQRSRV